MRTPADLPRRRSGVQRNRAWLIGAVVVVFLVITSLRGTAGFYTTYLWFGEVHLTSVWRTMLGVKLLLAAAFTVLFFAGMWASLAIADRLAPRFRPAGSDDELVARYRETVGPHAGKVRVVVAALFALLAGTGAASQWNNWLLFRNSVSFGTPDAQFHKDISFFAFKLPFLSFLVSWGFTAVLVISVVTLAAHYLNGGIRLQAPGQRVTPNVKAHLSVLLGALALVKTAGYYLQRYELAFSHRGVVDGPTYTDVHAQLPALTLLLVISLVAFGLFVYNIWRQGWVLPIIAVGLWAFIAIIVGTVYPSFIQRFRVQPAENAKERPYIARNIRATQTSFGLEAIKPQPFSYTSNVTVNDLNDNAETIRNVRLWDPTLPEVKTTFQRLQEIRGYYAFPDIDVDRYNVSGSLLQTTILARELNPGGLPANSFVNKRLQYTHGFGAVVSPANAVTADGKPQFIVKDVPPTSDTPELKIDQPRLYFGETTNGYAIVDSKQPELDYQTQTGQSVTSNYKGTGGVPMGSVLRRAAFALRFGDINPLISGLVTPKSRIMYIRDIGSRVRQVAPFLRYDADPYPVVVQGRIVWVQDAYTVSSRFPYAQRANTDQLPAKSGLNAEFNYVRNSVKVVIDAYNGSMTFYVMDEKDPIVNVYRKAFPKLFTPGSQMPTALRDHLRYPEDMFRVQTNMYGRYHISNPDDFYNSADAWDVSQDPGSGDPSRALRTITQVNQTGVAVSTRTARMDPTYMLLRLPNEQNLSFLILRPFVFASKGDKQQNLAAFVTAKSGPGADYGKLQAFVMPRELQVDGPALVNSRVNADPTISKEISLLGGTGSQVRLGNVLVLPVNKSLLYIRPLYVQASQNPVPELRKVIVVSGDKVAMGDTLQEALTTAFGGAPPTLEAPKNGTTPTSPTTPAPTNASVAQLLADAQAAYDAAQIALKNGDLGEYQRQVQIMADKIAQARAAAGASGSGSGSGSASATTTTTRPNSA
jgi:uncharacterized membrane protein (UPF0182 family)